MSVREIDEWVRCAVYAMAAGLLLGAIIALYPIETIGLVILGTVSSGSYRLFKLASRLVSGLADR